MNIKKEAYERIIDNLQRQIGEIDGCIRRNLWEFRKLEQEQGILKREKAEIVKLLGIVRKDKDGGK